MSGLRVRVLSSFFSCCCPSGRAGQPCVLLLSWCAPAVLCPPLVFLLFATRFVQALSGSVLLVVAVGPSSPLCPGLTPCLATPLSLSPPFCPGTFSCGSEWDNEAAFGIIPGFSHDIYIYRPIYILYPFILTHVKIPCQEHLFSDFFCFHATPSTNVTSDIGTQGVDAKN